MYSLSHGTHSFSHRMWLFMAAFLIKYGTSTAVSVCMGVRPVILKGPRHFIAFGIAFIMVQFCPGDWVYHALKTPSVRVAIRTATALYKHRKFLFVVQSFSNDVSVWSWCRLVCVAIIAADLTSMIRRTENTIVNRGMDFTPTGAIRAGRYVWMKSRSTVAWALALAITSAVRHHAVALAFHPQLAATIYWLAKVAALWYFLDRNDVPMECARGFFRANEPLVVSSRPLSLSLDYSEAKTAKRRDKSPTNVNFADAPSSVPGGHKLERRTSPVISIFGATPETAEKAKRS